MIGLLEGQYLQVFSIPSSAAEAWFDSSRLLLVSVASFGSSEAQGKATETNDDEGRRILRQSESAKGDTNQSEALSSGATA
jgi:hypothetical protein